MKNKIFLAIIFLAILAICSAGLAKGQMLPQAGCYTFTQNLKKGSTDAKTNGAVTQLQADLTKEGSNVSKDTPGIFGNYTQAAVIQFQTNNQISAIGIVGPLTRTALDKKYGCLTTTNSSDAAVQIQNLQDASDNYYQNSLPYNNFCAETANSFSDAFSSDNYSFTCLDLTTTARNLYTCMDSQWVAVVCNQNDPTDCFCTDADGGVIKGDSSMLAAANNSCTCPIVHVTGVTLNETSANFPVGGQGDFVFATTSPANATDQNIILTSSNPSVAIVGDNGLVSPISVGTTTITATTEDGGFTASAFITVTPAIPVTGISLNTNNLSLDVGKSAILSASLAPANVSNQNITWTSSNPAVVVDSDNSSGLVTAIAASDTPVTITAASADGKVTATASVTVGSTTPVTTLSLNQSSLTLVTGGKSAQLKATITPTTTNSSIIWVSSNPQVATVSSLGVVVPLDVGTATISATTSDGTFSANCTVNVVANVPVTGISLNLNQNSLSLTVGGTFQLMPIVAPTNAVNQNVKYVSSNPAVATVDANGNITAVSAGTASITVTTLNGNFTTTSTVNVVDVKTLANDISTLGFVGASVASSNPGTATATINNGNILITGLGQGTASITVSDNSTPPKTATIPVSVGLNGLISIGAITKSSVPSFSSGGGGGILSSANNITSFSFGQLGETDTIDPGTNTINVVLSQINPSFSLTNPVANIDVSPGATISWQATRDFNQPVTYTVIAPDGTTKNWTVNVTVANNNSTSTNSATTSPNNSSSSVNSNSNTNTNLSADALLKNIAVTGSNSCTLTPVFSPNTFVYNVTNCSFSAPFTLTRDNINSTISVSGNASQFSDYVQYNLPDYYFSASGTSDGNTVNIAVTSQDKSATKNYQLTIYSGSLSSDASISSVSFPNLSGVNVSESSNNFSVSNIQCGTSKTQSPVITVAQNATISPASGTPEDFTNPVTYTVTAQDGTTQTWTIGFGWPACSQPSATMTGLTIDTLPNNTTYDRISSCGSPCYAEPIDLTGLKVYANYSDGTQVSFPVSSSNITGFDVTAPDGPETVTIHSTSPGDPSDLTTSFTVTIQEPITSGSPPKKISTNEFSVLLGKIAAQMKLIQEQINKMLHPK